jgi:AraC-like DNA-binding protein
LRGRFGRVSLLDMDMSLVGHAHPHCHLIFKVSGPDQEFVVEGESVPLRRDTVVAVNAWQHHAYFHRRSRQPTLFLTLFVEPDWLAAADPLFLHCARPSFFPRACVSIGPEIERLRTRLAEHVADSAIDRPEELQQLILDLCVEVSYGFCEVPSCRNPAPAAVAAVPRDFRIGRALRYMRDNAAVPLDLDSVARISGLSRPHFNHLFRACTGLSPRLYLNALRIEAAVGHLQQRGGIGAISDSLGFSAQSNFARFFLQHTGTSPQQYRRVLDYVG